MFGTKSRSEFVIEDDIHYARVRVECRWQASDGSVDDKLVCLYMQAAIAMPEEDIILLIGGQGAKPEKVQWVKNAAATGLYQTRAPGNYKNIMVQTMEDFTLWAIQFSKVAA